MEEYSAKPKKRKWKLVAALLFLLAFFSLFFFKTSFTISQVLDWGGSGPSLPLAKDLPPLPEDDPDRLNILLMGMRGAEDPGDGKLLSDAIILLSIKQSTGQVAMMSFPRDLYAQLWCFEDKEKINFAYAQGGLECAKKSLSYVAGVYIDYAVAIDFTALRETIDTLGGITIIRSTPFEENFQWAKDGWEENDFWFIKEVDGEERWVFYVPVGTSRLDGETALYYVRSRYSTDDFDRMRRQHQVLMAMKDKALSIGVLANPIKIYNLLDILGKHVRTDMNLSTIKNMINLASQVDGQNIKTRIFDISESGLLYYTFVNEAYVLLPVGDDFAQIQKVCQNIFD